MVKAWHRNCWWIIDDNNSTQHTPYVNTPDKEQLLIPVQPARPKLTVNIKYWMLWQQTQQLFPLQLCFEPRWIVNYVCKYCLVMIVRAVNLLVIGCGELRKTSPSRSDRHRLPLSTVLWRNKHDKAHCLLREHGAISSVSAFLVITRVMSIVQVHECSWWLQKPYLSVSPLPCYPFLTAASKWTVSPSPWAHQHTRGVHIAIRVINAQMSIWNGSQYVPRSTNDIPIQYTALANKYASCNDVEMCLWVSLVQVRWRFTSRLRTSSDLSSLVAALTDPSR